MKRTTTISDEQLRTMLVLHAGSPAPLPTPRTRHRATRRTLAIGLAAVVLCGAAVPASRALLGASPEPTQQFVTDPNQPANARAAIERFLDEHIRPFSGSGLSTVTPLLSAATPDGTYGVYGLAFADGSTGTAVIADATAGVATLSAGEQGCPAGWSLEAGESFVAAPGKTPVYVTGRISAQVTAVDVVYPDGHTIAAAVGNGRFLAWAEPVAGALTPFELVARDSSGAELGELHVGAEGGIPRLPGQPNDAPSCA